MTYRFEPVFWSCLALMLACTPPMDLDSGDSASHTGNPEESGQTDTGEPEAHPLGVPVTGFALSDINPSSASHGQVIDTESLAGSAYSIIFLDSRCKTCIEVIADMWSVQLEHPDWAEALPLYAIQSTGGEAAKKTLDRMIEGHDMPYLQDTEKTGLWLGYQALNHDFFAVSEEGTLDVWLPLYIWPEDLDVYLGYLGERFEE